MMVRRGFSTSCLRVVERLGRVVATTELHLHQRLDGIGDALGEVDDLRVPNAQMRFESRNPPQARRRHRGVHDGADHAPALVDEQNELPLFHLRPFARKENRVADEELFLFRIVGAEIFSDRRVRVEIFRDANARASPRTRAVEGVANFARELLHQLANDFADELTRQREHVRVHQMFREEHRAKERLVRLDALEHFGVRDDFVDLVFLDGVFLEPLDRLSREESMDLIEPVGHAELVGISGAASAFANVALLELVAAFVEPLERFVGGEIVGAHPAS